MLRLIRKLLGLEKLEERQEEIEEEFTSLTGLLKRMSKRQSQLAREVDDLGTFQDKAWTRLSQLERKFRALEAGSPVKGKRLEFDEIIGEINRIRNLLQQVERNGSGRKLAKTKENKGSEDLGLQDRIAQLPSSLKRVIRILFEGGRPLTYRELADRMDKKEPTARSYIYRLKERSFPLKFKEVEGERKKVELPVEVKRQLTIPDGDG